MSETLIKMGGIDKVKKFVSITTKYDVEMDLVNGRYVIDAKSIMGIFSMDLSKPVILRIYEEGGKAEEILRELKEYVE